MIMTERLLKGKLELDSINTVRLAACLFSCHLLFWLTVGHFLILLTGLPVSVGAWFANRPNYCLRCSESNWTASRQ